MEYKRHYDDNMLPQGFSGGLFVYNAMGGQEIYFADQNVIDLFECDNINDFRSFTGNSFKGMVYSDDYEQVEGHILAQTFNSGKRHDYVRYRILTKKGNIRYIEDFGHLLHGENGQAIFYVFIVDVDKEEYYNSGKNSYSEAMVFLMNKRIDNLTGLLNMGAFFNDAQEELLDNAVGGERPSLVVVFDILRLRNINRELGREEGDARILELAEAIRQEMPADTQFFRGPEADIIAVCKNCLEKDVIENIQRIIEKCSSPILYGIGSTIEDFQISPGEFVGSMKKALDEAHYNLKVKKMLDAGSEHSQSLSSLIVALEEADPDTEEHVKRTTRLGVALGEKIGLWDGQVTCLKLLCLLHDIGKITVPLEILNKPGKLSASEWAVLRSHAEKGYQIAMTSDELKPIASMIRYHHERWDGRGYPCNLAKEEIPILSRIISIVDAYDAMVNDRCYRKAMPPEKAMEEIRNNAGTQFDPYIAMEFLDMLEETPSLAYGEKTDKGEIKVYRQSAGQVSSQGNTLAIPYAKYVLDVDEWIVDVDPAFEALTGYTKEDVVGKLKQYDLVPLSDLEQYRQELQAQFAKGDVAYLKHRLQCKDGTIKQVICHGERRFDSSIKAFRSRVMVFEA